MGLNFTEVFDFLSSEAHNGHVNHLVSQFFKDLAEEIIIQIFQCAVLRFLSVRALSVGSCLPSSQELASQKVGYLGTFQSSSAKGTHSLHIILLLLFLSAPLRSPPTLLRSLSVSLLSPLSKTRKPHGPPSGGRSF